MYEIELVETEKERVKIHYIGYSDKYNSGSWKRDYTSHYQ